MFRLRKYRDELLTAVTEDAVGRTFQRYRQCLGDPAQAAVASQMAVVIIKLFEVIDIENDDRYGFLRPTTACPLTFQYLLKTSAIRQIGKGIDQRQFSNRSLLCFS